METLSRRGYFPKVVEDISSVLEGLPWRSERDINSNQRTDKDVCGKRLGAALGT